MSPVAGFLTNRGDARLLCGTGLALFAVSMFLMSRIDTSATQANLLAPQILRGMGMGLSMIPFTVTARAYIPKQKTGQATGLYNLCRSVGGSLGIAWLLNVFEGYRALHMNNLVGYVDPVSQIPASQVQGIAMGLVSRGLAMAQTQQMALLSTYGRVVKAAAELAFRDMFLTLVALYLLTLPLLFLVKRVQMSGPSQTPAGGR